MRAPVLSADQFAKVMAHTDTMERPLHYRFMLMLSMRLGLRPKEMAGLDSSWFKNDELRIPCGYSKGNASRSLPVSQELYDALHALMKGRSGRVFLNKMGQPYDAGGISMAMRRLYKMAGVDGSAYSGRRTAASNMVDSKVNIRVVQEFLGHSNLATTAAYCSVTPTMLRRAVYGLDA